MHFMAYPALIILAETMHYSYIAHATRDISIISENVHKLYEFHAVLLYFPRTQNVSYFEHFLISARKAENWPHEIIMQ